MYKSLLICLLITVSTAHAEVIENLVYDYYTVNVDADDSIREALNKASPIRVNKRVFHGYTKWNVKWKYRWLEQADGRCKITTVTTNLTATITLPELVGATAEEQELFDEYLSALRVHELGHYDFGKQTAATIDSGILALPEMVSCKELEVTANDLGYQTLDEYLELEKQYDVTTEHGKTQGARLKN